MNRRTFLQIGTVGGGVIGAGCYWGDLGGGHEVRISNRISEPVTVGLTIESVNDEVEWEEVNTVPADERARRDTDLTGSEYIVRAEFAQGESLTESYTTEQKWYDGGCDAIETSVSRHSTEDSEQSLYFGVYDTACD